MVRFVYCGACHTTSHSYALPLFLSLQSFAHSIFVFLHFIFKSFAALCVRKGKIGITQSASIAHDLEYTLSHKHRTHQQGQRTQKTEFNAIRIIIYCRSLFFSLNNTIHHYIFMAFACTY